MTHVSSQHKVGLSAQELIQEALNNNEGELSKNGAIVVTTGKRTGRSPKDKFIVKDESTESTVDWGPINQSVSRETFEVLWQRAETYISNNVAYHNKLCVGADPRYTIVVNVVTDLAWHSLFTHHMFIRDVPEDYSGNEWTLVNAEGLKLDGEADGVTSDGAVMVDFTQRRVLLCGMRYAGEMKKSMFSVLNYLLTAQDVLPMHCAANADADGESALFFGLSGTGKTTLSADPDRFLVGDDEHGWGKEGVFNFEGGCYAKCIDLSEEREPVIWRAIRDGAVMENVVLNEEGEPDFSDCSNTQNTRAAYPLHHVAQRVPNSQAKPPKVVVFLTCDLFGVLPPVAKLTETQAAYYFLSGYTALVGSTEMGSASGISTTFSTCFGAPFFPRPASVYANLLIKRVQETGASVYLVNTGWTGGGYGDGGKRFDIPTTRAVITALISGAIKQSSWESYGKFGFDIPTSLEGVDTQLLNPEHTWEDKEAFAKAQDHLIHLFVDNFKKFSVDDAIANAGPNA